MSIDSQNFVVTAEQASAIQEVDEAYRTLLRQPLQDFQLFTLQTAVNKFASVLPDEVVDLAAKSWTDETGEDLLYNEYEYFPLLAGYILNDFRSLQGVSALGDIGGRLDEFANDLSQIVTYCPSWDGDHGVWL